MRYSSTLGVGSPTVRVLAILAATLLLIALATAAGAGATRLLAAENSELIVDASGGGTHTAIADAVADAEDGDTILVRPGEYVEAVVIDKDITLAGDGPREDIVISTPEDGPTTRFEDDVFTVQEFELKYALLIKDAQADIRGLTIADPDAALFVDGGSPTLSDLVLDESGLLIHSGSTATVTDSRMTVIGVHFADSEPGVVGNVLLDGACLRGTHGGVFRENVLTDPDCGISVTGSPLIEGNTVTGAGSIGISASSPEGGAGTPIIRDNIVSGSRHGIQVGSGLGYDPSADAGTDAGVPTISGNDVSADLNAISVADTDAVVTDNTVHDSWNGIVLIGGGSAEVMGNDVQVDGVGIDIGANTSPSADGNNACGGIESFKIHDTATPSMGENTTCDVT